MKSTRKIIEKKVITYLESLEIDKNAVIIAAFSGGPDSSAMVSILNSIEGWNLSIICAHFNHGLRDEAELEKELKIVRRFASENNLELRIGSVGRGFISASARDNNLSIEEAARDTRYNFLENISAKYNESYIASGHHLDDNAETMLMRFLQNSGVRGLSGIPPKRNNIIRPLIDVPKQLIMQMLNEEKIEYSQDETNDEQDFLRNKIRHKIVPVIKEVIPDFSCNMSGLSAKVRLYNSFIDDECSKRLIWSKTGDGWKINGKIFFNEHTLLRIQSVYSRLNTFQTVKKRIKFTALEKALSGGEPESGKILLQTAAFEVIYRNGYIFTQRLVNHNKKSYLLYLKPEKEYHTSGQIFKMFYDAADDDDDAQQLSLSAGTPLIVRSFREGDSIMIRDGRKSIKKLFNEWKVSSDERMRIPIVEDPDGIAAVIGLHLGYENKTAFGREDTGTIHKRVLLNFKAATETTGE